MELPRSVEQKGLELKVLKKINRQDGLNLAGNFVLV